MREINEILTELIDVSKDYELLCGEIRAKRRDFKEYDDHIKSLERKRDKLGERMNSLNKELRNTKEKK